MRMSEAIPHGRIAELYNPEMFRNYDEVIVFTKEEFNRTYRSMTEQIDYIQKVEMHLDRSEEWKLIGYWTIILERIHILDLNINLMLKKEPIQCYLDAYLYNTIKSSKNKVAASPRKVPTQSKLTI